MVNSSPEYSITKPGLHHLRKRDKPLRTYGRQTSTPEAQTEPLSKKPRLSAPQNRQEKPGSNSHDVNDTTKPDEAATAATLETKTKQDAPSRDKKEKREQSPKKGSILSYFKPATQAPKEDPPAQSQDSQPEEPIPPQPTPKRKQPARRKPRLLKIKAITHEISDQSSQETDSHTLRTRSSRYPLKSTTSNTPTTTSETTTPDKSSPSTTSPSASPKRKSSRNNSKSSPKTKPSSPSVQTTLNISTQAPFSECRICDTVWNPLYPDDVKFHNKTHKAVLRAQKRKTDDL